MKQKMCEILEIFLMLNLFSNTFLHKMFNTLLNISETRDIILKKKIIQLLS